MKKILIYSLILTVVLAGVYGIIFYTPWGAGQLVKFVVGFKLSPSSQTVKDLQGDLTEGAILKNIELADLEYFPKGTVLRIQELELKTSSWGIDGLYLRLHNARLVSPASDAVVIDGLLENGRADFNIFSGGIDLETLRVLLKLQVLEDVHARLGSVDIYVRGEWPELQVTGSLTVEQADFRNYRLRHSSMALDLSDNVTTGFSPAGDILIENGHLSAKKINLDVAPSRLRFSGDAADPELKINAKTKVNNVKITIALRGTRKDPRLTLTSDPPLSQEKLLVMVATGISWENVEASLEKRQVTADLAKDVARYFLLGTKEKELAEKMGIKDVDLFLDKSERGLGVTKGLTENIDMRYEVKQNVKEDQAQLTTQKIGAEVNVTGNVSVSLDRELTRPGAGQAPADDHLPPKDTILLKFKKNF